MHSIVCFYGRWTTHKYLRKSWENKERKVVCVKFLDTSKSAFVWILTYSLYEISALHMTSNRLFSEVCAALVLYHVKKLCKQIQAQWYLPKTKAYRIAISLAFMLLLRHGSLSINDCQLWNHKNCINIKHKTKA